MLNLTAPGETAVGSIWCDAMLCIWSSTLGAAAMTGVLGTPPTEACVKGEPLPERASRAGSHHEQHGWLLESEAHVDRSRPISDHLGFISAFVDQHSAALRALQRRCEIDVVSGIICREGADHVRQCIPHAVLRTLGCMNIPLMLDVYPPSSAADVSDEAEAGAWPEPGNRTWNALELCVTSTTMPHSTITQLLGTAPTSVVERTDLTPSAPSVTWRLSSGFAASDPTREHFSRLSRYIAGHAAALEQLRAHCALELHWTFASENGRGQPYLNKTVLARLGQAPVDLVINLSSPEGFHRL